MKKRISVIFIVLLFTIGLAVMIYPFFSNWYNQRSQAEIIVNYDDNIANAKEEELAVERAAAHAYNEGLKDNVILTDPFDPNAIKETSQDYYDTLNMNGDGIMGYIEIPKINVKLVLYHGTTAEVLSKGVGHLENTTLPVGGAGTHAVFSAHTGYPTSTLFTNLVDLEVEDTFYLTVLDEKLAYQVDQIKVVDPSNTSDLLIDRDEDLVTLVTCTPYGVNSHRLLVRGTRIPYVEDIEMPDQPGDQYLFYAIAAVIGIIGIASTIIIVKRRRRRRRKKNEA